MVATSYIKSKGTRALVEEKDSTSRQKHQTLMNVSHKIKVRIYANNSTEHFVADSTKVQSMSFSFKTFNTNNNNKVKKPNIRRMFSMCSNFNFPNCQYSLIASQHTKYFPGIVLLSVHMARLATNCWYPDRSTIKHRPIIYISLRHHCAGFQHTDRSRFPVYWLVCLTTVWLIQQSGTHE